MQGYRQFWSGSKGHSRKGGGEMEWWMIDDNREPTMMRGGPAASFSISAYRHLVATVTRAAMAIAHVP